MERSKRNEHVVCNKDDDVEDGVEDGDNGAGKHLTHLSQVADCCLMERRKQNEHVVCNKDNDVDNGDDDSVEDGVDDGDD
eukprot:6010584-Ditylum_brightwellii.AAC.1